MDSKFVYTSVLVVSSIAALAIVFFFINKIIHSKKSSAGGEKQKYGATRKKVRFADEYLVKLMLFYAPWCGHCKTAKPEFEKVVDKYNNTQHNGKAVEVVTIDSTDKDNMKITQEFKVGAFPTVKLIKNGSVVEYSGPRTEKAYTKFLLDNL